MAAKRKPKEKPIPIDTLIEQLAGRIQLVYRQSPKRAQFLLQWLVNSLMLTNEGDQDVRQTYTLEVKINFDDDERHKVMFHLMRKIARQVVGQVQLLADNPNRPAEVMFQTNDFYEGGTQHTLGNLQEDIDAEVEVELLDEESNDTAVKPDGVI